MSLIKSISGIRGTIGGNPGEGLSALDIVKFVAGYATFIKSSRFGKDSAKCNIVVGRDARLSGKMVEKLVVGTLISMGCDVTNIGMASTPTTELAVIGEEADGGIIITASHNPMQWNALKLLNSKGEFLNDEEGRKVIEIAESEKIDFAEVTDLGQEFKNNTWNDRHIRMVCSLPIVDRDAIQKANFKVAVDAVNSVGGIIIPKLLKALGVEKIIELNCEANGKFAHTPEPIPENLKQISTLLKTTDADLGIVIDPDVDRLALVMENGEMFGEEYTLVSVADYILSFTPGNTVSNLSSSRALRDITNRRGGQYEAAAVGEVNVVRKMKDTNAVIGGEGNGGVIYPELHYGRDALVGVAVFLTLLAKSGKKMTELRKSYPEYYISKKKITLDENTDVEGILERIKDMFKGEEITDIDGVKIDFKDSWIHLRKSNTEPIIRIYSEASTMAKAEELGEDIINRIKTIK